MKKSIKVSGMHCKSCEMLIEDSVSELEGIDSIKADHKKGSVEVVFDENKTTEKQIIEAIKKEGYEPK